MRDVQPASTPQGDQTPSQADTAEAITPGTSQSKTAPTLKKSPEPGNVDQDATRLLESSWPKILDLVRGKNPTTYAVLNSCKSRYMRRDELMLNFASDVIKEKMEQPESMGIVRLVLAEVFGREINVKCYIDTVKRDAIPPNVDNDGMVASALRDLGGELVDTQ